MYSQDIGGVTLNFPHECSILLFHSSILIHVHCTFQPLISGTLNNFVRLNKIQGTSLHRGHCLSRPVLKKDSFLAPGKLGA